MIVYPRSQGVEVLRFYRTFTQLAPEELTAYAGLLQTPDRKPAVAVVACYCGNLVTGEHALKPLRGFGSPLLDAIQPMPFPQMQCLLDGAFPAGIRTIGNRRSCASRAMRQSASSSRMPIGATSALTAVVVEYYGGAATASASPKPRSRTARRNTTSES
jgi:hypothetical protein